MKNIINNFKRNKEEKKKQIRKELEELFNEEHNGTLAGRKLDQLLSENGLKKESYSEDEKENIEIALLEAIWTMRFSENKKSMYAVLTVEEAQQIVKDIFIELDKIGYEIRKK